MPKPLAEIVRLNPLALLIEMAHNATLFDIWPSTNDLIYVFSTCFGMLVIGWLLFRKLNKRVDEVI